MITYDLFSNYINDQEYKQWVDEINSRGSNFDSPSGTNYNGELSMQANSNVLMSMKQRRQMVFEYYQSATDEKPLQVSLYINPQRMSISSQKIKGKQITRGGIFYHHWGEDHQQMQLSGTTGLSGMAGITELEKIYYASGTLLKYQNYGPSKTFGEIPDYQIIDYKDPLNVLSGVTSTMTNSNNVLEAQNKLYNETKNSTITSNFKDANSVQKILNAYRCNITNSENINTILNIRLEMNNWEKQYINTNGNPPTINQYHQQTLKLMKQGLPSFSDDLIIYLSNQLTQEKENYGSSKKLIDDSIISNMIQMRESRKKAIKNHINNLKKFNERDKKIRDILSNGINDLREQLKDEWLPRQVIIYFEDRAYVGHFDSFVYNRTADNPNLITYEIRFTITRQIMSINGKAPEIQKNDSTPISNVKVIQTPTPPPASQPTPPPTPTKKDVYVVKEGDTMRNLAERFYGNGNLWPTIWSKNNSIVSDPEWIFPGQEFVIPPDGHVYQIQDGDTLSKIAGRFYEDRSAWPTIYEANTDVLVNGPEEIQPGWIIKIP